MNKLTCTTVITPLELTPKCLFKATTSGQYGYMIREKALINMINSLAQSKAYRNLNLSHCQNHALYNSFYHECKHGSSCRVLKWT